MNRFRQLHGGDGLFEASPIVTSTTPRVFPMGDVAIMRNVPMLSGAKWHHAMGGDE